MRFPTEQVFYNWGKKKKKLVALADTNSELLSPVKVRNMPCMKMHTQQSQHGGVEAGGFMRPS